MKMMELSAGFLRKLVRIDQMAQETEPTSVSMIPVGGDVKPGVLYVGALSDLPDRLIEGTTFLCCGSNGKNLVGRGKRDVYAVDASVTEILNEVYPHFNSSVFDAAAVEKLTLVSISDSGLVPLLEMMYQISGIHVCIVDNFGKMIAFNSAMEEAHSDLAYTLRDIRSAEKQISNIEQNPDFLYFAWAEHAEEYMLMTDIVVNGIKVAEFAAFVGKEDPIKPYALVRFLSRLTNLEMQKDRFYQSNESVMETVLLRELIEGTVSTDRINMILKKINWTTSRWLQLMVIEDENGQLRTNNMRTISKRLRLLQRDFRSLLYNGQLILLFTGDWQPAMEECNSVGCILEGNNLLAGVSSVYQNIEQTAEAYQQAIKVLEYVRRDKSVGYMAEYRHFMYAIMYDELSTMCDPSHYCHPGVISIANKDRLNQTNLLKSLELYLEYVDDPQRAADELGISVDTLLKQIEKMGRAHRLHLDSGSERLQIMLTIKFLQSPRIRVEEEE